MKKNELTLEELSRITSKPSMPSFVYGDNVIKVDGLLVFKKVKANKIFLRYPRKKTIVDFKNQFERDEAYDRLTIFLQQLKLKSSNVLAQFD